METNNNIQERPSFGRSFGQGMQVLGDNFLSLLLIIFIMMLVQGPAQFVRVTIQVGGFNLAIGVFALMALVYSFLVIPVFTYGANILFVHAVRKQKVDYNWMVKGFSDSYLNIILSNLLVFALVMIGIIMLLVPGIIISCRLVFVSRLVMDRNLDPIAAIEESWRLTRGYGWTIFGMGLVSFFIILFGLLLL
ncbi:MAG: hypothetical protein V2I37_03655, partial [Marinilabiliaceae bacterium]|nr:hypothetical protein [Marinilabiliaceae bacterium]